MRARSWYSIAACHEVLGDLERATKLYRLALDVTRDDEYVVLAGTRAAFIACSEAEFDTATEILERVAELHTEGSAELDELRSRVAMRRAS